MNDNPKEKIINIENISNKRRSSEKVDLGSLLANIYSTFASNLKPKFIAFFESLDDTLFDLSEKTDSNTKQTQFFDSMLNIRKSRKTIFNSFFSSIKLCITQFKKNEYDYFKTDNGYDPKIKSLSLSLIDENDLDETLAKTNLINKSEMAYHRHLFALEKRFSVLASGVNIKTNQLPIGPHTLVYSFSRSIEKLDLDVNIKLIMYKIFERCVMGHLNEIYNKNNDLFVKKGIIPTISYNLGGNSQSSVEAVVNNTNPNQNIGKTEDQPYTPENINDENYKLISDLFSHNNQNNESKGNDNPPNTNNPGGNINQTQNIPNIDIGSMLNALSIVQSDLFKKSEINQQTNKSPTEIKDELIKQLHNLDSSSVDKRVKQQDEDTIDLVGMLFQFLVDDRNLPDTIQVILAKLQIPYLKIALQDRNLFADKSHPARVLLDKLSLASVGWTKESDYKMLFLSKVEDITYEILEIEEYSHEKYLKLQYHLEQFLGKRKKKSDVAQKRTNEKKLGQERINQAKEISAKLLVDKMTNKQMPILVRDILLGEWSSVLNLIFLRSTADSIEYKEKVKFVDVLIRFSQPIENKSVQKEHIVKISKVYGQGLKLVAFNQKETIDKQHELVKCLLNIHKLNNAEDIEKIDIIPPEDILKLSEIKKKEHDIVNYIEEIIVPKAEIETHGKIENKYIEMVKSLKKGVWLEFLRKDETTIRAKLSWISPITGKYLFVNSRGLKITDKSLNMLASGLQEETIRVLQQVAIFDRALTAIATKLKKEK